MGGGGGGGVVSKIIRISYTWHIIYEQEFKPAIICSPSLFYSPGWKIFQINTFSNILHFHS